MWGGMGMPDTLSTPRLQSGQSALCVRRSGREITPALPLAHRLGAVQRLPDDVGVAGVLRRLGNDVQEHPSCRPALSRRTPRRFRKRLARVEVRHLRHQLVCVASCVLVVADQASKRLARQHPKAVYVGLNGGFVLPVTARHCLRAFLYEVHPTPLDSCDVLDEPAYCQLAGCGPLRCLLVREFARGVDEETAMFV